MRNPIRWQNGRTAYICVNPGIRAHFQLIHEVLQHLHSRGVIDAFTASPETLISAAVDFIEPLRVFVCDATDRQIEEKFSRKFGEGGVVEYFYNMCDIIGRKQKEFGNDEFKKFKAQQADARLEQTERDISDLQNSIVTVVVESLKGTSKNPSRQVRANLTR